MRAFPLTANELWINSKITIKPNASGYRINMRKREWSTQGWRDQRRTPTNNIKELEWFARPTGMNEWMQEWVEVLHSWSPSIKHLPISWKCKSIRSSSSGLTVIQRAAEWDRNHLVDEIPSNAAISPEWSSSFRLLHLKKIQKNKKLFHRKHWLIDLSCWRKFPVVTWWIKLEQKTK